MRRVVAIGPMPPPSARHGLRPCTDRGGDRCGYHRRRHSGDARQPCARLRYHASKIVRSRARCRACWRRDERRTRAILCRRCGIGGYYSCPVAGVARLLGLATFLHHHNYNYLVAQTRPIAWLTRMSVRPRSMVLCDRMAEDLRALYPAVRQTIIAPNGIERRRGPFVGKGPKSYVWACCPT